MAAFSAATTHQLKPFSFSTEKCPRYEFFWSYLRPIFSQCLLAFLFALDHRVRHTSSGDLFPWIFVLMGLILFANFLWKLQSSFLNRHRADRKFTDLSPQLKMQIKTLNRPFWGTFLVKTLFIILIGGSACFLSSVIVGSQVQLQIHWWILGSIGFAGILLSTLLQISVDLQRIGRTPPEEFIFYDIGLVWANRRPGLGHAPENEFFPWSSIAAIVWREPTQWLPQTLAIRGTDPLWDRWIKFRNLSDEDRDNLLNNLAQYVPVSRE